MAAKQREAEIDDKVMKDAKKRSEGKGERKEHKPEMRIREVEKGVRYIVRIAGKDLNGTKPVFMALRDVKGIGHRMSTALAHIFEQTHNISMTQPLGKMTEDMDGKLEEIVMNPGKYGIPTYMLNRQRDPESGEAKHLTMADWDFQIRNDIQRMGRIRSYKGLRHSWGVPVRGQKTKSTHRHGGGAIGVVKKMVGAPPIAAPAAKGEAKK